MQCAHATRFDTQQQGQNERLWAKSQKNQDLAEFRQGPSFHSTTAVRCADTVICLGNTDVPSNRGSWHRAPRQRGRSDSGFRLPDFGKHENRTMVGCTQPRISPREIIGIDRARVPGCLLHSYDTIHRFRTHNLTWSLRNCSMSVKMRNFWRPHGCTYKSTRFVMPGEPIRPNISPRPT